MMFTALGTLFGVHASASLFPTIDVQATATAIAAASDSLHQLSNVNPLMASCSKYFESLRKRMEKMTTGRRGDQSRDNQLEISNGPEKRLEAQRGQDGQRIELDCAVEAFSVSPGDDGAGSLDEDWTRLFLEPMLPDFTDEIFNI